MGAALVAVLVEPIMPNFSRTILKQLNVTIDQVNCLGVTTSNDPLCFTCVLKPGHVIGDPEPLVREIKPEEVDAFRKQFSVTQAERGGASGGEGQKPTQKLDAGKFKPLLEDAVKAQSQVANSLKGQDKKAASDLLAYLKKELYALKV